MQHNGKYCLTVFGGILQGNILILYIPENPFTHFVINKSKYFREIENGRIVRLLTKLSTVVDRAEFNLDIAWAETGDRLVYR